MRKIISLLLVLVMVFSFTACGKDHTEETLPHQTGETSAQQTEDATTGTTAGATDATEQTQPPQGTTETTAPTDPEPQPSEGTILETIPGNAQSYTCSHSYQVTATKASTCSVAGTKTYTCTKCQSGYTEAQALLAHDYTDATCTAPKTCTVCFQTSGQPLGHSWNKYNYCAVCGVQNTEPQTGPVTFQATVKSDENVLIAGVTVQVYTTSSSQPAGTAVTNSSGVATVMIERHSNYKVTLSDIPEGYSAKESYTFTSATVNISLKTEPVYDPLDHSRARYKAGDTMADFTLTDTDGNTYTLSQLRNTKKLIILDFWYNTCEPCKAEFPLFEEAVKQYGDEIILLAVNPYNDMDSIRTLRAELGYTFPMVVDSVNLAKGFDISAFPTTVFIDNTGKIRKIHAGSLLAGTKATQEDITNFLNMVKVYL